MIWKAIKIIWLNSTSLVQILEKCLVWVTWTNRLQCLAFWLNTQLTFLALASSSKPYSKTEKIKSHCFKVHTSSVNSAQFPCRPRDSGYQTFPRCEGENRAHCHKSLKNFELFSPPVPSDQVPSAQPHFFLELNVKNSLFPSLQCSQV